MDFSTNNFEIFSCQHVSAMLNFKIFFLLSHVLTFNFNFNMSSSSMNVMWVWILFNFEYAWLNFSFPHSNLFYFHLDLPP